jgi:hypothetical protein
LRFQHFSLRGEVLRPPPLTDHLAPPPVYVMTQPSRSFYIIELLPFPQYGIPTQVASLLRGTMPVIPTVVHPHCKGPPAAVASPPRSATPGYISAYTWLSRFLTCRRRTCSLLFLATALTIYFFFFNNLCVTLLYITLCNTLSVQVIAFVTL